jgi:uncharacterized protein
VIEARARFFFPTSNPPHRIAGQVRFFFHPFLSNALPYWHRWWRAEEEGLDVLVSGATGLIGSALVPALRDGGHQVRRLTRSVGSSEDAVAWDPSVGTIDTAGLQGVDAVVHLAGESVMGRWTSAKKTRIRNSRVQGTRLLAETIADLPTPPEVMVCASATGYYGDRGNELLTEESDPGNNFLAGVCREWEVAADPARAAGVRVVHPRFGIVLSPEGGALGTTLPIFKLGGGGRLGSGRQYWPWIAIGDVVGAIIHVLDTGSLSGAVNVTVPDPPTNEEYTKTLGHVLGRPTIFPLPAPAARLALGQIADELPRARGRSTAPAREVAVDAAVHESHMRRAIEIARGNFDAPFGCVIADRETGEVLAEGLNDAEKNPILHGEIDAVLNLARADPDADWTRLILDTTAEPCPMCSGAILWCGIPRVVFGTSIATLERLDLPQISLSCGEIARSASSSFAHPEITGGVLEGECDALFEEMARRMHG